MIYQGGPGRGWPHGDAARPGPYTVFTRRRAMFWVLVGVLAVGLTTCGNAGNTAGSRRPQGPPLQCSGLVSPSAEQIAGCHIRLLVFSKTGAFRHASIPDAI